MRQWAKIHAKIGRSRDFAAARGDNKDAATLFLMLLPHCDVYGIHDADPLVVAGSVAPLFALTADDVIAALKTLQKHGLIMLYQDREGRRLLWVRNYCQYQQTRWSRVGPPEYDLPPGWEPPDELRRYADNYESDEPKRFIRWWREWSSTPADERTTGKTLQEHSGSSPGVSGDAPDEVPPRSRSRDRSINDSCRAEPDNTEFTLLSDDELPPERGVNDFQLQQIGTKNRDWTVNHLTKADTERYLELYFDGHSNNLRQAFQLWMSHLAALGQNGKSPIPQVEELQDIFDVHGYSDEQVAWAIRKTISIAEEQGRDIDKLGFAREVASGYEHRDRTSPDEHPPDLRETGGGVVRNTLYEHELKKKREGRGRYADDGDG